MLFWGSLFHQWFDFFFFFTLPEVITPIIWGTNFPLGPTFPLTPLFWGTIIPQGPVWHQWFKGLLFPGGRYLTPMVCRTFTSYTNDLGAMLSWGPLFHWHQWYKGLFSLGGDYFTGIDFGNNFSLVATTTCYRKSYFCPNTLFFKYIFHT